MPRRTAAEIREKLRTERGLDRGVCVTWTGSANKQVRYGMIVETPDDIMFRGLFCVISSNGAHDLPAVTLTAVDIPASDIIRKDQVAIYGDFCDECHKAPCGCELEAARRQDNLFWNTVNECLP